jgi:hypothetical protein
MTETTIHEIHHDRNKYPRESTMTWQEPPPITDITAQEIKCVAFRRQIKLEKGRDMEE